MSMSVEQIRTEALALKPTEREALAEELLLSLTDADRSELDAAWAAEINRRIEDFDAGRASSKSVEEVVERLLRKAGS